MKFITVRELRSKTREIRKDLEKEKDMVLTANGHPFAILSRLDPDSLIEDVIAIRRARARSALDSIRADAKKKGLDKLSMDQIDRIVTKVRKTQKSKAKGQQ